MQDTIAALESAIAHLYSARQGLKDAGEKSHASVVSDLIADIISDLARARRQSGKDIH